MKSNDKAATLELIPSGITQGSILVPLLLLIFKNDLLKLEPVTQTCSTQVFYCKICEISKNIFSYRTPPVSASESRLRSLIRSCIIYG